MGGYMYLQTDSKSFYYTVQMLILVWIFDGLTCHLVGIAMKRFKLHYGTTSRLYCLKPIKFKPGVLFVGHIQTVHNQTRRHRTRNGLPCVA